MIEFIFMLTHDDATVPDALGVLAGVEDSGLRYVGFKDVGQPPETLTQIAQAAHAAGLEVMLEVVSTSLEDELTSVRAAIDIGVDWVLGGTNPGQAGPILAGHDIRYCPFRRTRSPRTPPPSPPMTPSTGSTCWPTATGTPIPSS
jgi:hypothetical protein